MTPTHISLLYSYFNLYFMFILLQNQLFSAISEFILLEFSDAKEIRILYFLAFLVFYLAAVTGNLLIILAIAFDHHLHTPMYFFLMNLATQDLGQVSVIIPRPMANALMNTRNISYSECVTQVFFFISFTSSDFFLLTVMAYDRYIAICYPLQYEELMNKQVCTRMIASVWVTGLVYGGLHAGGTFASSFCSNLLRLACSDTYLIEAGILSFSLVLGVGCIVFIIRSYVFILISVFRIPSTEGRQKAFSTCLPHLMVFSLFSFTGYFAHLKPFFNISSNFDLAFTMMYSLVPPIMNPVIYSMRSILFLHRNTL
uniref:Olfactory receptor n=1 Tax=Salvator merianae TaxID=96440 RepID=A0A8D0B0D0_SALMN